MPAIIQFEILVENNDDKQNSLYKSLELTIKEDYLILTPEYIRENFLNLEQTKNIIGFKANIACENFALDIKNFKSFELRKFEHATANISLLRIYDIGKSFQIDGLSIVRLDIEKSDNIISNCNIQELNLGIETNYHSLLKGNNSLTSFNTDIRGCRIDTTYLFVPQKRLNIQKSVFERVIFINSVNVEDIDIWENTTIKSLTLVGFFKKMRIKYSTINRMIFTKKTRIDDFEIESVIIEYVHNADKDTFINKTVDSWRLVAESATNNNDSALHSLANFQYLKLERKSNKNFFQKQINLLMELTSGYGYKPSRTVITSIIIWLVFAIVYWMVSKYSDGGLLISNKEVISGLKGFGYACYFSLITFTTTAFGDIIPIGFWAKLVAGIQTLLGISFMSLFIFALTKRYSSFK